MTREMEESVAREEETTTQGPKRQPLSIAPIKSLKRVNVRNAAGQFLLFSAKVAALEAIRRVSQIRCRPIWWGVQGLCTIQAPPFSWLQRWSPFQQIARVTQSFSKPLLFLSLATAVTGALEEVRNVNENELARRLAALDSTPRGHSDTEDSEEEMPPNDQRALTMHLLKEELEDKGIFLPERMDDDELGRFLEAAKGNVSNFVARVKKTVQWRERHHIFSTAELKRWEHLVYWHGKDAQGRPALIVRLGLAFSTLDPADHPGFAQAVVSQVEAGVLKLARTEDPSITVILDCECEETGGFPIERLKSRALLLQDHYPSRLSALLAVNVPPEMRGVAHEVIQVLSPVTQKKVHLKGYRRYMGLLAEHLGGAEKVPPFFGGSCKCRVCSNTTMSEEEHRSIGERQTEATPGPLEDVDCTPEDDPDTELESAEQSYMSTLRLLILGLLMFWIVVAMVAGHSSPRPSHN